MANTNKNFEEYNEKIRLTNARRESLKGSRKELRNKVRRWFLENKPNEPQPKFEGQGSMPMDTIINPITRTNQKGEKVLYYDVDDGIYFKGDKSEEDRPAILTYHIWIVQAVTGHTQIDPIDKRTCVRTVFADGHNIDQPIYYHKGDIPQLAHKQKGWIYSDPRAFTRWFNERADLHPQLRRLVRAGKGWSDFREYSNESSPMPSGMILTILLAENFVPRPDRDDIALKETLLAIHNKLSFAFECKRPTTPAGENLLEDYKQQKYFMDNLSKFIEDATKALQEKNLRKSSDYWRKHLGDRFPLGEDKDDDSGSSERLKPIIPPSTKPYAQ